MPSTLVRAPTLTWCAAKAPVKVLASDNKMHGCLNVDALHAVEDGQAQEGTVREPGGNRWDSTGLHRAVVQGSTTRDCTEDK